MVGRAARPSKTGFQEPVSGEMDVARHSARWPSTASYISKNRLIRLIPRRTDRKISRSLFPGLEDLGEFSSQVVQEHTHRRQQAFARRHQCSDPGIASGPFGQDSMQLTPFNGRPRDIPRQSHDP